MLVITAANWTLVVVLRLLSPFTGLFVSYFTKGFLYHIFVKERRICKTKSKSIELSANAAEALGLREVHPKRLQRMALLEQEVFIRAHGNVSAVNQPSAANLFSLSSCCFSFESFSGLFCAFDHQ